MCRFDTTVKLKNFKEQGNDKYSEAQKKDENYVHEKFYRCVFVWFLFHILHLFLIRY